MTQAEIFYSFERSLEHMIERDRWIDSSKCISEPLRIDFETRSEICKVVQGTFSAYVASSPKRCLRSIRPKSLVLVIDGKRGPESIHLASEIGRAAGNP